MKWIEPQSRFVMTRVFKRNFDAFTQSGQQTVNWAMLIADVVIVVVVLSLL